MKNAIDWIKSNPISAASIVIAFLGVVVFLYVLFVQAPALRKRVVDDNSNKANDLNSLTNASVQLPNPDPNEPPIPLNNLVINQQIIDYVEGVYDAVGDQSASIKGASHNLNRRAHEAYTFAGGELFADNAPPTTTDLVNASEDYRRSFDAMFMDGLESLHMPRLVVGMPPPVYAVEEAVGQALDDYLQSVGADATGELTQQQAEELYKLQQQAAMDLLSRRAREITLYADVMPLELEEGDADGAGSTRSGGVGAGQQPVGMARYSADYPFQIADWAFAAETPSLDELWEGQVQVWITRDIMEAIRRTNSTQDVGDDGVVSFIPRPVIEAPVKRLLRLEVVPGYVGLHSGGGINPVEGTSGGGSGGGAAIGAGGRGGRGGMMGGRGGGLGGPGGMSEPGLTPGGAMSAPGGMQGGEEEAATQTETEEVSEIYGNPAIASLPGPKQAIVDSFFFGPTGRYSNSVFDVRHARLSLIIEWAEFPAFAEQLRLVNFMSVIDMEVTDIDEYGLDALGDGYVYGTADVVRVDLVIETLWYRDWTAPLMPEIVKKALAVQPEQP